MAHTAMRAADSQVLRAHETLSFRIDRYAYQVARVDGKSVYSVSDGPRSLSAPLAWAFGVGRVGQSYLFERDGSRRNHVQMLRRRARALLGAAMPIAMRAGVIRCARCGPAPSRPAADRSGNRGRLHSRSTHRLLRVGRRSG